MLKRLSIIFLIFILFCGVGVFAENDVSKRYILVLDSPSVAEQSSQNTFLMDDAESLSEKRIADEQQKIISSVENISADEISVIEQLDTVLNCIVFESENVDIDEVRAIPGIKAIYEDPILFIEPDEPELKSETDMVNVSSSTPYSVDGISGENMIISVIDGGFDINHEIFKISDKNTVRLTQTEANSIINNNGLAGVYLNEKIPYYRTVSTSVLDHGTHVAGIIAGNSSTFRGVAPEAQLMLIGVCESNGGIYLSNIVAGIDDSVKMGADCINISIGTPVSFPDASGEEEIRTAIYNANSLGVTVCHSAGNDGRNIYNGTYDSSDTGARHLNVLFTKNPDYKRSCEWAADTELTVGSMEQVNFQYISLDVKESQLYLPLFMSNICSDWQATDKFNTLARRKEGLKIVYCGDGTGEFPSEVKDHIALIKRNISGVKKTYRELAVNAFNAGAVGVILADDFSEDHVNYQALLRPGIAHPAPDNNFVVGTAAYIADIIIASSDENGIVHVNNARIMFPDMASSFTSWGVTNDLKLVPSLSAYGTNIKSALPSNRYGNKSGTSMSSPHVTGAVALVKQKLNGLFSAEELNNVAKNLLMSTAELTKQKNTGNNDTANVYISPRQVGLGNINPQNATLAQCLILGTSDLPKIDLKEIDDNTVTFSLTLQNITAEDAVYSLTCNLMTDNYMKDDSSSEYIIKDEMRCIGNTFSLVQTEGTVEGNTVTVPAYGKVLISGKFKMDSEDINELKSVFENGFFVDGIIDFESQSGSSDLHCALMGFYGQWNSVPAIDPYSDTVGSYFNRTGLYRSDGTLAGVNKADISADVEPDKVCVGDNYKFTFVPLRNIRTLTITADEISRKISTSFLKFDNYKYSSTGANVIKHTNPLNSYLNEGEHLLSINTTVSGFSDTETYQIPFIKDLTPPNANVTYCKVGDCLFVNVTANDNFYVQYAELDGKKYPIDSEKGGASSVDITAENRENISLCVFDYADNKTTISFSTVIKDERGNIYSSLKEAIEGVPSGTSTLTLHNYCEQISETVVVPEDKNIIITGSANFSKADSLILPSVKVLGNLECDSTVSGLEISAIPMIENINYQNEKISVMFSEPVDSPFVVIFAASYDENGTLIDCVRFDGNTEAVIKPLKEGVQYAVFVWDKFSYQSYDCEKG